MAITQIIATLPAVLNDSATFYEDIAERNNSLVTTVLPSINAWATQANLTQTEINAKALQVAAQAVDGGYSQDYINNNFFSKNYINDNFFSQNYINDNFIGANNAQDITGVKTFTVSPIVPTPITSTQAVNKAYVDNKPSGFKNYIINGRFDIWQRGTSVNIAGGEARCADMFLAYSPATTPTASRDSGPIGFYSSLKISGANSLSNKHIIHRIEAINTISLGGGNNTKITFSLWLKADVNSTVRVAIRVPNTSDTWSSYTTPKVSNDIQITTSWDRYSVTFDLDFNYWGGIALAVYATTAQTSLWTTGWQLEQGSVATPLENRPTGLELSLCQRYLPVFNNGMSCLGQAYNGNLAGYSIKLPVSTRVAPTGVVSEGNFTASRGDGTTTPVFVFAFTLASIETVAFNASLGVSFLTAGQASHLVSTGGKIYFTGCEL